jgi:hypothetical protein
MAADVLCVVKLTTPTGPRLGIDYADSVDPTAILAKDTDWDRIQKKAEALSKETGIPPYDNSADE